MNYLGQIVNKVKRLGDGISDGFNYINHFCAKLKNKVIQNFNDEEILDELIKILHVHTKKRPDFKFSRNTKKRLNQKKNYLLKQAVMFISSGMIYGASNGMKSGDPETIILYPLGGGVIAILIIVVVISGVIIVRRYEPYFSKN